MNNRDVHLPPATVSVPRQLNVAVEYVNGAVHAGHGERPAYLYEGGSITFEELRKRVNRAGNALAALGVSTLVGPVQWRGRESKRLPPGGRKSRTSIHTASSPTA